MSTSPVSTDRTDGWAARRATPSMVDVAPCVSLCGLPGPQAQDVERVLRDAGYCTHASAACGASCLDEGAVEAGTAMALLKPPAGQAEALVRSVRRRWPLVAVLVLTDEVSAGEFDALVQEGVSGYLASNVSLDRLPIIVQRVLEGETAYPRALLKRLLDHPGPGRPRELRTPDGRRVELTPREAEVLQLLRRGYTTPQVAARLFVAPVTVRSHILTVCRKLRVGGREEALQLLGPADR